MLSMLGMLGGSSLGTLFVRLTADSTNLVRGMNQAQTKIESSCKVILAQARLLAAGVTAAFAVVGVLGVRAASKFEDSFTGVRKTVDLTEAGFKELEKALRDIAMAAPVSVNELSRIAEVGGQLGISGVKNLTKFTETISKFTVATGIAGDEAATSFARIANVMKEPIDNIDRMGSVVAQLGDSGAATEREILDFTTRMAGAGQIAGLTTPEIFGIATAFSEVGIEAEAGGTAVQQVLLDLNKQGKRGIGEFIKFMKDLAESGTEGAQKLDELGLGGARLQRAFLSLAGTEDILNQRLAAANIEWEVNNRLNAEAEKRYATFSSQLTILKNIFIDLLITVGQQLTPALKVLIKMWQDSFKGSEGLSDSINKFSTKIGPAFVKVIGFIGDAIWGWKVIFEAIKVIQMTSAVVILSTFKKIADTIAAIIEKMVNGAIAGINKAIVAMNTILPDSKQLPTIKWVLDIDLSSINNYLQAFKDLKKEALNNWNDFLNKGSFSERFKKLYDEAIAMVGAGNKKMVEGVSNGLKLVEQETVKTFDKMTADSIAMGKLLDSVMTPDMKQGDSFFPKVQQGLGDPDVERVSALMNEVEQNKNALSLIEEQYAKHGDLTEGMNNQRLAMMAAYNEKLKALQIAESLIVVQTSQKIFEDLSSIAKTYAGEQSGIYKAMFAASKAFAIAESIIKIQQGIANAASLPWPANLVAIGSVVAATANIVSAIQATNLTFAGGKARGGPVSTGNAYMVGEEGPELFTPGSNGAITPNDRLAGGSNVKVIVNNYTDAKAEVNERSEGGEKVIEVLIRRVKDEIGSDIRDGHGNVTKAMETFFNLRRGR